MEARKISSNKVYGGLNEQHTHFSEVLDCQMRFSIFLPPGASQNEKVPALYWLSGLTCTDENFIHKAGAQRTASALGIALIVPDTSPRGEGVPDDPDGDYDFGLGAGFYVNATQEPWRNHYQMYDYVVKELPGLMESTFPINDRRSISGHSMGGHGALVIALRNPQEYLSVSAFSPICNPISCAWGEKAFSNYLGEDRMAWRQYDATELMKTSDSSLPILIDQGDADEFLTEQLKPGNLEAIAKERNLRYEYRLQTGYDHSYFFISSFIEDHLRFHAEILT
ncbi:S-formylglutathione hydrolase [Gammaproteobacteria bacterium]|nr:S-formylglutathione hydrolase [Gammaproteobacteria bacterium]